MLEPSLELRAATAVYSPPRPPADRRSVDIGRLDQTQSLPTFDTLAAWEQRTDVLRQQILNAAGLCPLPPRTPLEPQVGKLREFDGYAVQTVALQSRPGFYLTGNIYRPSQAGPRLPGLLNPHGHSRRGRLEHTENSSTPARCITFARQGYVAFAYDMVGYNDARQIPHHYGDARDWLWGLSALGLQLWNSVRALDFLLSLPEVDPARIGCVGESGGGTQTFLLAAIDERVRYVAPVVMVSAHYQGGCVCENAPGLRLGASNVEIAAMAAPRPMTLVSATGDWTCNTPSVEYPAIRRIYELYGAADRLSETQITAPHNFNQGSREAVYRFFAQWFQGTPAGQACPEPPLSPPPDEALRVFPDSLPADALDSNGLRQAIRREAEEQLRVALPTDAATLQAFDQTYGSAYRTVLDPLASRLDPVEMERLGTVIFGAHQATRFLLRRTTGGARVPALYFAGSEAAQRPAVLVHANGKAAFFVQDGDSVRPGTLLSGLLNGGRPVVLIDAFLTGDYQTPAALSGR
ncbi:MAG TPA: acetylxylan esterase, partial [Chloroflexota bacterium]|nr:acetylxylan esterase [Chloroflexota bacterium]